MRYFLEVSYKGTNYAGFQVQLNANTIQAEVEKALNIFLRSIFLQSIGENKVKLTGSSRTDSSVHALQNFFHFDCDIAISPQELYSLNALLPNDIAIRCITKVNDEAHCRFDAISREYKYYIIHRKDPFRQDTAWFYPYKINMQVLNDAAAMLHHYDDFSSFAKRKSQAKTNTCTIIKSEWTVEDNCLVYNVKANRFLRGMIRGLVGTMLLAARNKISLAEFENIILSKDCTKANFASPGKGLFLVAVEYPAALLNQ